MTTVWSFCILDKPGPSFSSSTESPKSKAAKGYCNHDEINSYIILLENNCVWFFEGFL